MLGTTPFLKKNKLCSIDQCNYNAPCFMPNKCVLRAERQEKISSRRGVGNLRLAL
jgi:hypothetical protein